MNKKPTVGEQVTQHREAAEMSKSGLARKAGFTQPLICKVEQGKNVNLSTVQAIADALQVEITIHPTPPILTRGGP